MSVFVPTVVVKDKGTEKAYDIFSMLLKERIIMINDEITDSLAGIVTAELLYLDSLNHEPIYIYINTPGGSVNAGLSIIDMMNYITSPVSTIVTGTAASMGSVIFASGEKGMRYMQPHSRIMLHQASSGFSGNVQDTRISFEQTEKLNKLLLKMLGELSGGKTLEEMEAYTIRDKWMDAEESIEFQIADKIVTPKK